MPGLDGRGRPSRHHGTYHGVVVSVIASFTRRVIETLGSHLPIVARTQCFNDLMFYLAAIPLGPGSLITVIGLLIDPVVVSTAKPVMLLELVFDT
jgi:hypothetical protein